MYGYGNQSASEPFFIIEYRDIDKLEKVGKRISEPDVIFGHEKIPKNGKEAARLLKDAKKIYVQNPLTP